MSSPLQDLSNLDLSRLRRAIDVYLQYAYPDSQPPEVVRRRLDWPPESGPATLLTHPPFERASRPSEGEAPIFALRLGNQRYPHMKLQIQPWANPDGFLLTVNTHDQALGLTVGAAESEAFRALQAENQRIKESIEQSWDEAGLPTFLRFLREYINACPNEEQAGGRVEG